MQKILALDVEGTLITGYDYTIELADNRYPPIIDPSLNNILLELSNLGYIIVLATGTDGDNLDYYNNQFAQVGFVNLIKAFSPALHSKTDSKWQKLEKYQKQFNITNKADVYFYDDAENNVNEAKNQGFDNSFRVTDAAPLAKQLQTLLDLTKKQTTQTAAVTSSASFMPGGVFAASSSNDTEKTPLVKIEEEKSTCACCTIS